MITGQGAEGVEPEDRQELHDLHVAGVGDDSSTIIGDPLLFPDWLESSCVEGRAVHVAHEPVHAPVVAGRDGRNPTGPPQANIPLANPAG